MEFMCKYCKNKDISKMYIKTKSVHTGLYCKKCNNYIKWLDLNEADYINEYNYYYNFSYPKDLTDDVKIIGKNKDGFLVVDEATVMITNINYNKPIHSAIYYDNTLILHHNSTQFLEFKVKNANNIPDEELITAYSEATYYLYSVLTDSYRKTIRRQGLVWNEATYDLYKHLFKLKRKTLRQKILCQLGIIFFKNLHKSLFATNRDYELFCNTFINTKNNIQYLQDKYVTKEIDLSGYVEW